MANCLGGAGATDATPGVEEGVSKNARGPAKLMTWLDALRVSSWNIVMKTGWGWTFSVSVKLAESGLPAASRSPLMFPWAVCAVKTYWPAGRPLEMLRSMRPKNGSAGLVRLGPDTKSPPVGTKFAE